MVPATNSLGGLSSKPKRQPDGCREAGDQIRHSPRYCDRGRCGTADCQPLGNWEGAARTIRKSGHLFVGTSGVKETLSCVSSPRVRDRVTWGDMTFRKRAILLCVLLGQLGPVS